MVTDPPEPPGRLPLYWSRYMDAPDTHPALRAALELTAQGRHVHYVAEGQQRCLSDDCPPEYP